MNFDDFKIYLRSEKYSKLTIENYVYEAIEFDKWLEKNILQTTEEDIQQYVYFLQECNAKPRTINKKICAIHRFFIWTKEQNLTGTVISKVCNFRENIKCPQYTPVAYDVLTNAEIAKIIAYIDQEKPRQKLRDKVLFPLMIFRGAKASELLELKVSDLIVEHQCFKMKRVNANKIEDFCYLDIRFMYKDVLKLIRSLPNQQGYLFLNYKQERISIRNVIKHLSNIVKKCGINKTVNVQHLRFNFLLKRLGKDSIKTISKRLGYRKSNLYVNILKTSYAKPDSIT